LQLVENGGLFRRKRGENRGDLDGVKVTMILEYVVIPINSFERFSNREIEKPLICSHGFRKLKKFFFSPMLLLAFTALFLRDPTFSMLQKQR
jgi:hypothetical protein